MIFDGMVFVHVQAVNMAFRPKEKKVKKKRVKNVNVPVTGRHALLSLVVFCSSFIHSVCTIYDHAFGVYIGLKESVIKGVIKGYIILCTIHYLLLIMATF